MPVSLTGSGRGGTLEIIVDGEVQGAGGAANSGSGGTAFHADQSVSLTINGAVRGGGGGGGSGGTGGNGGGLVTETFYKFSHPNFTAWTDYNITPDIIMWYGTELTRNANANSAYNHGGWSYTAGAVRASYAFGSYREVVRSKNSTTYGGAGGAGGRGTGYGVSFANGSAGAAGGSNAGTGGTGGTGGGAGGAAISGSGNVSLTNNGTINGSQI